MKLWNTTDFAGDDEKALFLVNFQQKTLNARETEEFVKIDDSNKPATVVSYDEDWWECLS